MRAFGEGRDLVQEALGPGEHLAAANGIIAAAAGGAAVFGQRVGAVERIVQAAPAGVGGVERVAGVGYGHDELRAGDARNLIIDVGGIDSEVGPLGNEVADLDKESLVRGQVERLALARPVPRIDLGLQVVALFQQCAVSGRQVVNEAVEARPESGFGHAGAWQRLFADEIVEYLRDTQAVDNDALGHAFWTPDGVEGSATTFSATSVSISERVYPACSRISRPCSP